MPASTTTSIQKTYKEDTITFYARVLIGATNTQPTLITDNGASKGIIKAEWVGAARSNYRFTLDASIRVVNVLGVTAEIIRSPTAGLGNNFDISIWDINLGTPDTGCQISVLGRTDVGGSAQLPQNSILCLTLVITTSNTL
jgi:hypothetical protein